MTSPRSIALAEALNTLRAAQHALAAEITAYPTPISGCDAQFNHLPADRRRITEAIAALNSSPFIATPRSPAPGAGDESR